MKHLDAVTIAPLGRASRSPIALTQVRTIAVALAIGLVAVGGCSTTSADRQAAEHRSMRVITAGAFAEPAAPPVQLEPTLAVTTGTDAHGQPLEAAITSVDRPAGPDATPEAIEPFRIISADAAREQVQARAHTGAPRAGPAGQPLVLTQPAMVIDAKVGDINGKAIYASAFFESLDARFTQEARSLPRNEWLARADAEIRRKLNDMVNQELLRAEALASMSPEQRRFGIRAFMNSVRRDLRLRNQGSTALAGKRLAAENGSERTVDDLLKQRTEQALVAQQLDAKVRQRVHVSWREVRREYDRLWDEFNPKPTAVFRLIRVRTDDAEALKQITDALAAGMPFAKAAALDANGHRPADGGLITRELTDGLASVSLVKTASVNDAARQLARGAFVGPVEADGFSFWIELDRVEHRTTPLYDAQLLIAARLEDSAGNEEYQRYLNKLKADASFTDLDRMARRLLTIAADRYFPLRENASTQIP